MKSSLPLACALVLALSSLSATAFAQDAEEESSSGLSGTFAVTNDYVFRGVSQTNEDPAFQAGLTYTAPFGLYVGTWVSNVDFGGGDPDWEVDAHALPAAHEVVAYLNADWHLLPGDLPRAGHLDDAIALDTAWPLLRPELCNYQDFRRLRTLEAEHRGCRYEDVAFDRQAWREAREMEARLHEQLRRIRDTSYAPAAPACFRVH